MEVSFDDRPATKQGTRRQWIKENNMQEGMFVDFCRANKGCRVKGKRKLERQRGSHNSGNLLAAPR